MEAYLRLVLNQINTVFSKYTIFYNYKESNVCYNLVYLFVLFFATLAGLKKLFHSLAVYEIAGIFPKV